MTKKQLLTEAQQTFTALMQLIESVPPRKRTQSAETHARDRNFRDVLMHVYEWHAMLERWYREGMDGDIPDMPAAGYKWRDLQKLNDTIWANYQHVTLTQALSRIQRSHARVMQLIEAHTDEEIMTKKYYKWTKTSHLYSYFAANTVEHYRWAIAKCTVIQKLLEESACSH